MQRLSRIGAGAGFYYVRAEAPNMDNNQHHQGSYLFTLRLWAEELGNGQTEWRGKVQHVTSGEVCYLRDWQTLITLLLAMLPDPETNQHHPGMAEPTGPDGSGEAPAE